MEDTVNRSFTNIFYFGCFWCHGVVSVIASTLAELQTQSLMCSGVPHEQDCCIPTRAEIFTDNSLCPCQQHFNYGPHEFSSMCSVSDITLS